METRSFRFEEILGLTFAVVFHIALIVFLVTRPPPDPQIQEQERVVVNLASEIALETTSPDPVPDSQAAAAPVVSDAPMSMPEVAVQDNQSTPEPAVVPMPRPKPAVQPKPKPKPKPKVSQKPKPKPKPRVAQKPKPKKPKQSASKKPPSKPSKKPPKKGGSNKFADAFSGGKGTSSTSRNTGTLAAKFGPQQQAALRSAITRQLRPHWKAPQGVDAEKIVTVLRWRLNKDGSLAGKPVVVRQSGINAANKAQASVHAEQAIRAVRKAAPFKLPSQYYSKWSNIRDWRFDRKL